MAKLKNSPVLFTLLLSLTACLVNGEDDANDERRAQWHPQFGFMHQMFPQYGYMHSSLYKHPYRMNPGTMHPPMTQSQSQTPMSQSMKQGTYHSNGMMMMTSYGPMYPWRQMAPTMNTWKPPTRMAPAKGNTWMAPAKGNTWMAPAKGNTWMTPSMNTPWMAPAKGGNAWMAPPKGDAWMRPATKGAMQWKGKGKGKGKGIIAMPTAAPSISSPTGQPTSGRPTSAPTPSVNQPVTSPPTAIPTSSLTFTPTGPITNPPTGVPTTLAPTVSNFPSTIPSLNPSASQLPSGMPSLMPSVSNAPSDGIDIVFNPVNPTKTWSQVGKELTGEGEGEAFGYTVDISADGTILAVGALYNSDNGEDAGSAKVYRFNDNLDEWEQMGQDLDGDNDGDLFGSFVELSKDGLVIAVGGTDFDTNENKNAGIVRVFYYYAANDEWAKLGQDLVGEGADDSFGIATALSGVGSILAVGALYNDDDKGHAKVYEYNVNEHIWVPLGQPLTGDSEGDEFGVSVDLSEDGLILAVGGWKHDDASGDDIGHVQIFEYDDASAQWVQMGNTLVGEAENDHFGISVSLSADGFTVAVGAFENDGVNGEDSGHVRIYKYDGQGLWEKMGQDIDGEVEGDNSGWTVDLSADGTIVAIGAYNNNGGGDRAGHIRIFEYDEGTKQWFQLGSDVDGQEEDEFFGAWVSLTSDGQTVAAGGDGGTSGVVRVYSYKD